MVIFFFLFINDQIAEKMIVWETTISSQGTTERSTGREPIPMLKFLLLSNCDQPTTQPPYPPPTQRRQVKEALSWRRQTFVRQHFQNGLELDWIGRMDGWMDLMACHCDRRRWSSFWSNSIFISFIIFQLFADYSTTRRRKMRPID